MMNSLEKSDLPIVAMKLANGAVRTAEELVERRGGTRENVDLQNMVRTQSREAVSRAQARIREALARNRAQPLTTFCIMSASMFCGRDSSTEEERRAWGRWAFDVDTMRRAWRQTSKAFTHVCMGEGIERWPPRRRYIPEGGWAASTAGHCRAGQDCPSGGGGDPDAYLRGGILGFSYGFRPERWTARRADALSRTGWGSGGSIGSSTRIFGRSSTRSAMHGWYGLLSIGSATGGSSG